MQMFINATNGFFAQRIPSVPWLMVKTRSTYISRNVAESTIM